MSRFDKVTNLKFSASAKKLYFYDGMNASRKTVIFAREIKADFFNDFFSGPLNFEMDSIL